MRVTARVLSIDLKLCLVEFGDAQPAPDIEPDSRASVARAGSEFLSAVRVAERTSRKRPAGSETNQAALDAVIDAP
jgi:hypothetical protein